MLYWKVSSKFVSKFRSRPSATPRIWPSQGWDNFALHCKSQSQREEGMIYVHEQDQHSAKFWGIKRYSHFKEWRAELAVHVLFILSAWLQLWVMSNGFLRPWQVHSLEVLPTKQNKGPPREAQRLEGRLNTFWDRGWNTCLAYSFGWYLPKNKISTSSKVISREYLQLEL